MSAGPSAAIDTVGPDVGPDQGGSSRTDPNLSGIGRHTRNVIEAIQRPRRGDIGSPRTPLDVRNDRLPALRLPGFGEMRDDCGDDFLKFCPICGDQQVVGRSCNQSMCSRCAPNAVRIGAARIATKIGGLRAYLASKRPEDVYYQHVVFSPPPGWALEADDQLERTIDVIKEIMKEIDLEGKIFYHPWALQEEIEEFDGDEDAMYHDRMSSADRQGDDRGDWKRVLFNNRDWDEVQENELEYRPHFHVVGAASRVIGGENTAKIYEETGWVIHRITQKGGSNVSIYNDEDLMRCVEYCLSHTAVERKDNGDMWFVAREAGSTMAHEITVEGSEPERFDYLSRIVAPDVLGLETSTQVCDRETTSAMFATNYAGQHTRETARRRTHADSSSGAGGDQEDVVDVDQERPDEIPDAATETVLEREQCNAPMLPIHRAPEYLDDPDWRSQAEFGDELEAAWMEWSDVDPEPDPPPID